MADPDFDRGIRRPLLRMLGRQRKPVYTPLAAEPAMELETTMDEIADAGREVPHWPPTLSQALADPALVAAAQAARDADGTPPPGVLGYAVGVFPDGGNRCSGFTHTGRMELGEAQREAGLYRAAASDAVRGEPSGGFRGNCAYRAVEIREVPGAG
jgi:hypothetical protein